MGFWHVIPFGLIALLLVTNRLPRILDSLTQSGLKCPWCGRWLRPDAQWCHHCRRLRRQTTFPE
jgi:hypothetical protein